MQYRFEQPQKKEKTESFFESCRQGLWTAAWVALSSVGVIVYELAGSTWEQAASRLSGGEPNLILFGVLVLLAVASVGVMYFKWRRGTPSARTESPKWKLEQPSQLFGGVDDSGQFSV